jgi:hypothetical protein
MRQARHKKTAWYIRLVYGLLCVVALLAGSFPAPHGSYAIGQEPCPSVSIVGCPTDVTTAGTFVRLTAAIVPRNFSPTYTWTLTDLNGTDRSEYIYLRDEEQTCTNLPPNEGACIKTSDLRGDQIAKVSIGNWPKDCKTSNTASCQFTVVQATDEAQEFATYTDDEAVSTKTSLVVSWANTLKAKPEMLGVARISPRSQSRMEEAFAERDFVINTATKVAPDIRQRLSTVFGEFRPKLTTELWIVPPGATLPAPNLQAGVGQPAARLFDIAWSVLPQSVCGQHFGRSIRKHYYCVNIQVGNTSDHALRISSVEFTAPIRGGTPASSSLPSTDYGIVRSTLEHGRFTGPRNRVLTVIKGLGPVLTAFTPFFRNDNPRATFAQLTNILSNPVEKGFELAFPDETVGNLRRLDDLTLRNSGFRHTIVPGHTQLSIFVFVPKDTLSLNKTERDQPVVVTRTLGELVLWGDLIESW